MNAVMYKYRKETRKTHDSPFATKYAATPKNARLTQQQQKIQDTDLRLRSAVLIAATATRASAKAFMTRNEQNDNTPKTGCEAPDELVTRSSFQSTCFNASTAQADSCNAESVKNVNEKSITQTPLKDTNDRSNSQDFSATPTGSVACIRDNKTASATLRTPLTRSGRLPMNMVLSQPALRQRITNPNEELQNRLGFAQTPTSVNIDVASILSTDESDAESSKKISLASQSDSDKTDDEVIVTANNSLPEEIHQHGTSLCSDFPQTSLVPQEKLSPVLSYENTRYLELYGPHVFSQCTTQPASTPPPAWGIPDAPCVDETCRKCSGQTTRREGNKKLSSASPLKYLDPMDDIAGFYLPIKCEPSDEGESLSFCSDDVLEISSNRISQDSLSLIKPCMFCKDRLSTPTDLSKNKHTNMCTPVLHNNNNCCAKSVQYEKNRVSTPLPSSGDKDDNSFHFKPVLTKSPRECNNTHQNALQLFQETPCWTHSTSDHV